MRRVLGRFAEPVALERLRRVLLSLAIATGALDAWFYRQWNLNPDGVSYFDLARALLADGPTALVSGYWSPLFPGFLGLTLGALSPDMEWAYPAVRLAGFVLYMISAFAFDRLVRHAERRIARDDANLWTAPAFVGTAWGLFFLLVTQATGLHLVTPDTGVAAIVFILGIGLIELSEAPWTRGRWLWFGILLGAGYWWKAILLPVGGVAFVLAAAVALRRRDHIAHLAASGAAFVAIALALAIPVSRHVGRPTFGETGRLNQLWYVNNAPMVTSLCTPPDGSLPLEWAKQVPVKPVIVAHPLTCALEDDQPHATLPLWYDPTPMYAGTVAHFSPRETLVAVRNDVRYIAESLAEFAPASSIALVIALLALIAWRARPGPFGAVVLMSGAAIGAYLIVYVELRHVVPFLLLVALASLVLLASRRSVAGHALFATVAIATLLDVGRRAAVQQRVEAAITLHEVMGEPRREQLTVLAARALVAAGLKPGDRVATVNAHWNVDWAQRAGLVVRAYVAQYTYPVTHTFAELNDACVRAKFLSAMRARRIKAVVLREAPGVPAPSWFAPLDSSSYRVHIVGPPEPAPANCAPTRSSSGTGAR